MGNISILISYFIHLLPIIFINVCFVYYTYYVCLHNISLNTIILVLIVSICYITSYMHYSNIAFYIYIHIPGSESKGKHSRNELGILRVMRMACWCILNTTSMAQTWYSTFLCKLSGRHYCLIIDTILYCIMHIIYTLYVRLIHVPLHPLCSR